MDHLTTSSLQRAMVGQIKRYNALPHFKRGRQYGRWLYGDIRQLNETILSEYIHEPRRTIP